MAARERTIRNIGLIFCIGAALMSASAARAADKPANAPLPGLVGEYADGAHTCFTIAPTPDFVLQENESIHPQLGPQFTATWSGVLIAFKRGKYTLSSSGEASITLDGKEAAGKEMELDGGEHPIALKYTRKPGAARLQLLWRSEFFAEEPVPSYALAHRDEPAALHAAASAERGRDLVEHLNCVACHHAASSLLATHAAPDLSHVGSRDDGFWIYKWLENPKHFRPQTAMPAFPLSEPERRDLATYLVSLKLNRRVKEDAPQPKRIEKGKQLFESVGCTACHGRGGVSLEGMGSKTTPGQLTVYLVDPLAVDPSGRMPSLMLRNEDAQEIAEYLVQSRNKDFEGKLPAGDAKNGEKLFRTQGCMACHAVTGAAPMPESQAAPAFEKLGAGKGCLADEPAVRAVRYELSKDDRNAIGAFIASSQTQPLVSRAPAYELPRVAAEMRCVKCHELDAAHPADVDETLPQLTAAGSRLRPEWMNDVLTQKKRARNWFKRRMPDFGAQNVADVPALLIAAGGSGDPEASPPPSREQIAQGQVLMGTAEGGLGCLACHSFNNAKPEVIDAARGPEMTTVTARLRADFFRRWMRDPKRIQPATAMPSFFMDAPVEQTESTITSLWAYASLGTSMPPPKGWIDKENYTLSVGADPVVMRCNLPADGKMISHGIAVGLPGQIAFGFDGETSQLRLAWVGGFLDMQPVWSGRGGGVARVLGKIVYKTDRFPLQIGEGGAKPQVHFDGYETADKAPVFLYRVDGVAVREKITALDGGTGLVLSFELNAGGKDVSFVAPDERGVAYACSAGALIPSKGVPGAQQLQAIRIPADKAAKFTVTITMKEGR